MRLELFASFALLSIASLPSVILSLANVEEPGSTGYPRATGSLVRIYHHVQPTGSEYVLNLAENPRPHRPSNRREKQRFGTPVVYWDEQNMPEVSARPLRQRLRERITLRRQRRTSTTTTTTRSPKSPLLLINTLSDGFIITADPMDFTGAESAREKTKPMYRYAKKR